MVRPALLAWLCLAAVAAAMPGCRVASAGGGSSSGRAADAPNAVVVPSDPELDRCRERLRVVEAEPASAGAPAFDARRAEILGRAKGEPMVWVREPAGQPDAQLSPVARATQRSLAGATGGRWVRAIASRHAGDRPTLRALLLREGYVYASDPHEALALVTELSLPELFDEPTIFVARASDVHELRRTAGRYPVYRHLDGSTAELVLGDRVASSREALAAPLHRDLRGLSHELGFDRARVRHQTATAMVAELRFAGRWVPALLQADGARLALGCFDAPAAERKLLAEHLAAEAPRRAALARLRDAIAAQVAEAIPFDRPKDEKTAERDGQLRPEWRWAYQRGLSFFTHDEQSYPVFDARGRALPPQMCVDFVLDSFERASGTWFGPRGQPERRLGRFDFDRHGIKNRSGVLAFEKFAQEHPALFAHSRMKPEERIPFAERGRFFRYLLEGADRFRPGDVVAIHGRKADGLIHQHAILIEDTDPITGFPSSLADQMKRPRRRTWEGIMAEAPLRSLLFHVRPKDELLLSLVER